MGRFYTSKGAFVGWNKIANGLISLLQAAVRKATGHIPRKPWIPFVAIKALGKIVDPNFEVWEIGSGYSTLWLADRVGKITSIEASKDWYSLLKRTIEREKITNTNLVFEWRAENISDFSKIEDNSLDLLFIDGGPRYLCLVNGFNKVKKGGYIYMDNWDNDGFWLNAKDFLDSKKEEIKNITSFIDYVPAQFGVYEGCLIRKKS